MRVTNRLYIEMVCFVIAVMVVIMRGLFATSWPTALAVTRRGQFSDADGIFHRLVSGPTFLVGRNPFALGISKRLRASVLLAIGFSVRVQRSALFVFLGALPFRGQIARLLPFGVHDLPATFLALRDGAVQTAPILVRTKGRKRLGYAADGTWLLNHDCLLPSISTPELYHGLGG